MSWGAPLCAALLLVSFVKVNSLPTLTALSKRFSHTATVDSIVQALELESTGDGDVNEPLLVSFDILQQRLKE
jgi:hypothetical protein